MDLQNSNTKKMITLSMLIALQVVLTRIFSINAWNIRIGFGFIPMLFAALYFGTWEAVTVASLADIIGSLALSSYPYFPGYTFSIALSAFIFATILRKNKSSLSILLAVAVTQLICSLLLNSLWISINSGSALLPIMLTRLIQVGINGAMQFFTIQFMVFVLEKRFRLQELNP
mgnify:FL=1